MLTSVPENLHISFGLSSTSLNFDESPGTTLLRFVSSPHCLFRNSLSLQRLDYYFIFLYFFFLFFLTSSLYESVCVCVCSVVSSIIGGGYSCSVFQRILVGLDLWASFSSTVSRGDWHSQLVSAGQHWSTSSKRFDWLCGFKFDDFRFFENVMEFGSKSLLYQ